jgi:hypothetical protein
VGYREKRPTWKPDETVSRHPVMALFHFYLGVRSVTVTAATAILAVPLFCQTATPESGRECDPAQVPESSGKRVLGIIPNYRTYPSLATYEPITSKEKLKIAVDDSFDQGTVALAVAFAGLGLGTKSNPSLGVGVAGYARYFGTSYADFVIGNFMTEAVYPAMLHQDPRYFRRGTGSGWSRLGWAMGQIFWTRTDSGGRQFNFSEIGGNATAAAISTAYYPEGRNVSSTASKLSTQVGLDMAGNVLKEFWPDLQRKLSRHRNASTPCQPAPLDKH